MTTDNTPVNDNRMSETWDQFEARLAANRERAIAAEESPARKAWLQQQHLAWEMTRQQINVMAVIFGRQPHE